MNAEIARSMGDLQRAVRVSQVNESNLRNENARLRSRVAELEALLTAEFEPAILLGLTAQQEKIVKLLYGREFVSCDGLMTWLHAARPDADRPNPNVIKVQISKIRSKFAGHGIKDAITTACGRGYFMSAAAKETLASLSKHPRSSD